MLRWLYLSIQTKYPDDEPLKLPCFYSGIYGVPRKTVAAAIYKALTSFDLYLASLSPADKTLMSIYFVNTDETVTGHLIEFFKECRKLIKTLKIGLLTRENVARKVHN